MTWRELARHRLARIITRLALCDGGCRQPPNRCTCTDLPRLPDEP